MTRMKFFGAFPTVMAFALSVGPVAATAQTGHAPKPTLYYIPHTHWEGAVFLTREEYLEVGLDHILEALRLLEKYPDYKFTLDQVAYFKPFLERYPEQAARFRKFIAECRLEIVGGMDVMPDDVKVGGELFVRQMQYGKGYCRTALGLDVEVAWLLDTFGHHPQMPQLLKLAGFKSFWFCRGIPTDTAPSEFLWKGIDGSTIPAFCLPGFYGLFYGPPADQAGFDKFFVDRYNFLNPNARPSERAGLAGVDVSEPEDYVTPLLRKFNLEPSSPFKIRYSVPTEFANVVAKRKDTPTFDYDLNPIFPGTYSSRIELKQRTKQIETKLLEAEQMSVLCGFAGLKVDDINVQQAWEPLMFNQTHDLASGTMNDHVYVDTVKSYDFAERLADEALSARRRSVCSQIDTSGPGSPIVVFNAQGWARTDLVHVDLGFADNGARGVKLVSPSGEIVPVQIGTLEKYGDGALKRVKLAFVATAVPACGYATYRALPASSNDSALRSAGDTIENEFYRVKIDLKTGAILSVLDRQTGLEALSAPGNVVARTTDNGDLWELYKTLDGGSHLPTMLKQTIPTAPSALLSVAESGEVGKSTKGDAYEEVAVVHALGTGKFATRVRLTRGVKRIDIETDLANNEKHVRYQVLFPTSLKAGHETQEIPFGSVDRPLGVEYPAQNWIDFGDANRGVALVNAALPGNLVKDGTIMLSLMRSENLGDYNGGDTSDTGFELGMPRTFRYSLVPHSGSWRQAQVVQAGQDLNAPLVAVKGEPHKGSLPASWGLLSVSAPNVVITSVKPGRDGTVVVRLYESWGRATNGVRIRIGARVASAVEANLLEETGRNLRVNGDTVVVDLHPYQIETIALRLGVRKLFGMDSDRYALSENRELLAASSSREPCHANRNCKQRHRLWRCRIIKLPRHLDRAVVRKPVRVLGRVAVSPKTCAVPRLYTVLREHIRRVNIFGPSIIGLRHRTDVVGSPRLQSPRDCRSD